MNLNTYHNIYSTSDFIGMAQNEIDSLEAEYDALCKRIEQMNCVICYSPKNVADNIRSTRRKLYNKRATILRRIKRNKACITNYKANYTQKTE